MSPSSGFWDIISIPPSLFSNSAIRTASAVSGELSSRQILLHVPEYLFLHTDTNIALPVFITRQFHLITAITIYGQKTSQDVSYMTSWDETVLFDDHTALIIMATPGKY